MARIHYVKSAQQRYEMVPKLDDAGAPVVSSVKRRNGEAKTTKRGREVTRRATVEDRTKPKPMPKCGKCLKTIEPGQPYRWVKTKSGPYGGATLYRCATCPTWKPSELSSSKMSGVYAAQEQCDEQLEGCAEVSDLEELRDELADQIKGVGEEYEESAQNIEDGFGHETSMSEELKEKGESLKSWAEDIRNVSFEEFDGEDEVDCTDCDGTGKVGIEPPPEDGDDDCEACEGTGKVESDEAREEWIEEQRQKLSEDMGNCPV